LIRDRPFSRLIKGSTAVYSTMNRNTVNEDANSPRHLRRAISMT
jgi:hypothetical protein